MHLEQQTREQTAQIILNAVQFHERQVGIGFLALILQGSKSRRVFDRQLHNSRFFGALFYYSVDVIENFIKQLIQCELVTAVNIGYKFFVPVLQITDAGKKALEEKQEIQLQDVRMIEPLVIGESAKHSMHLFQQLKSVLAVAKFRGLAESTIWEHLIVAIKLGLLRPSDVVEQQKIAIILETKHRLKTTGLKDLKEALPADISYGEIRCATLKERSFEKVYAQKE